MTFILTYEPEFYKRIMFGVIVDNRANIPAIKNAVGTVIKDYVDSQTTLITESSLFYKIETSDGNLSGYFSLDLIENAAGLKLFMLRPNFRQFATEIVELILNFIQSGNWQADKL